MMVVSMPAETCIKDIAAFELWARDFLLFLESVQQTGRATVVALSGDLGAGKTTLVQALARTLGVTDVVTSPTFTIMKRYNTTNTLYTTLYHLDVYRIDSDNELAPLRFLEMLQNERAVICIEWAEKIKTHLPAHTIYVSLQEAATEGRIVRCMT